MERALICSSIPTQPTNNNSNKRKASEDESKHFSADVTSATNTSLGISFKEPGNNNQAGHDHSSKYFPNTTAATNTKNHDDERPKKPKKNSSVKRYPGYSPVELTVKIKELSSDLKVALDPLPKGENLTNLCINADQYNNLQTAVNNIHNHFIGSSHTYRSTLTTELFEEYKIALQTLYNYYYNIKDKTHSGLYEALMTKIMFAINYENDANKRTNFLDGFHANIRDNLNLSFNDKVSKNPSFKCKIFAPTATNRVSISNLIHND